MATGVARHPQRDEHVRVDPGPWVDRYREQVGVVRAFLEQLLQSGLVLDVGCASDAHDHDEGADCQPLAQH